MPKTSREREDEEVQSTEISGKADSTNTAIVRMNTFNNYSGNLVTIQRGQVGIQVIGDKDWFEQKVQDQYDILLEFTANGEIPTYLAFKNYTAARGQQVSSQTGNAGGKLVSHVVQGYVDAHAPFLSSIPLIGDIVKMVTGTFTETVVQEVITQSLTYLINLSIERESPNPGKDYWSLELKIGEYVELMKTSAYLALIESDRHFRYELHFQYIGRLMANIYVAIYEDFFSKFIEPFLSSSNGLGVAFQKFVEESGGPTGVLSEVMKRFKTLMAMDFSTLVEKMGELFTKLYKFMIDRFNQYVELAKEKLTEINDDLVQNVKDVTLGKLKDMSKSVRNGTLMKDTQEFLQNRYNDFWEQFQNPYGDLQDDMVEEYKMKWMIELAYKIFSPGYAQGNAKMVAERVVETYVERSIYVLSEGTGGNPDNPQPEPVPTKPEDPPLFDGRARADAEERDNPVTNQSCCFMVEFRNLLQSVMAPSNSKMIQSHQYYPKPWISHVDNLLISSPLLQEVDDFLNVKCAQIVKPFLDLVSAMSGMNISDQFQSSVQLADTEDPEIRGVNMNLGKSSDGHDWSLCISLVQSYGATFSVLKDGEARFELPSVGYMLDLFGGLVGVDSLSDSIPGPINEIGKGLSLNGLAFIWPLGSTPQILCGVKFSFDEQSIFASDLGLKAIYQTLELNFLQDGVFFNTSFVLSIGNIQVAGFVPASDDEPFVLDLITQSPVTLSSLITSIPGIGDISDTGLGALASDDVNVEIFAIGLGQSGIEFFDVAVASTMSPRLGKVQIKDPYVSLSLVSPFTRYRSATLGYMFSLTLGSFGSPLHSYGELTYQDRKLSGVVSGTMLGSFGIGDIFDLDSSDMPPDLVLTDDIKISFDLTQPKLEESSISLVFGDDRILEFSTSSILVAIGGPEQLAFTCSFPTAQVTGGMLDSVGLDYSKKVDGQRGPRCIFSTAISMQDNLIEDGLQLLGPPGQAIIQKEQLTLGIVRDRKKTRMLFPDNIIPQSITFGNDEQGLTITDAQGFVNPGKRLEFGAGGKMDLNILDITTLMLAGELSVGPQGFSGFFAYEGDIPIGTHIVLESLGVVFEVLNGVPRAGAETTFRLYEEQGELKLTMDPVPAPSPSSFRLSYPGELSIRGIVDAFLGDKVNVPGEVGDFVILSGTIDTETQIRGSLVLDFDVPDASFEIDCYLSVLYGFFEGSVKGSFSAMNGFHLDAWLKPIDLVILKISGADGTSDAKMDIIIPGPFSNKEFYIFVDGSVNVLGITRSALIEVKIEGTIRFKVSGDMWNVLTASLEVYGDVSNSGGLLEVEAIFEDRIIETITENSHALVNTLIDGAREGILSAKRDLENYRELLEELKKKRVDLIEEAKQEQEELVKNIRAAENEVLKCQAEVDRLNTKIEENREKVRKERENFTIVRRSSNPISQSDMANK